jgi:nucleoid DNA-binding protein
VADLDQRADEAPKKRKKDPAGYARLVIAVARELDMPAVHVRRVLDHYHEVLRDEVWQQRRVHVPKVGVYRVRQRKARAVVNPQKRDELVQLPMTEGVAFRASKNWRTR